MDHSTTLDSILIQSNLLPDQIYHPGFGMYFLLNKTQKVAHYFDLISVLSLNDLSTSLNPLACVAELATFNRRHSPFLGIAIVIFLWATLYLLFQPPPWIGILALLVLGSQESLVYHASMIRSEFYAVFLWSLAILTFILSIRTQKKYPRLTWLFLSGVLLGLAFTTKIQVLVYIMIAPIIFLLGKFLKEENTLKPNNPLSHRQGITIVALGLFIFVAFITILILSYSEPIPSGIASFSIFEPFLSSATAKDNYIGLHTILLITLLLSLSYFQISKIRKRKIDGPIFTLSIYLSIVFIGFLLAFLLHFLLHSDLILSWKYLLYNTKVLFLRPLKDINDLSLGASTAFRFFLYMPITILAHIGSLSLLCWVLLKKNHRTAKKKLLICLALSLLALLQLFVGTRYVLRDVLWIEILLNFLTLIYISIFISKEKLHKRYRFAALILIICPLIASNCTHSHKMIQRIDANYNVYGWNQDKWFAKVFNRNHLKYQKIMLERYDDVESNVMRNVGRHATRNADIRRLVSFVFRNQSINLKYIGIVHEYLPVWTKDLTFRIVQIPEKLRGGVLVDSSAVPVTDTGFLRKETVIKESGWLDKFAPPNKSPSIVILPRTDIKVFIFLEANDYESFIADDNSPKVSSPGEIELANVKERIVLKGIELSRYSVIPLERIKGRYFFVIHSDFTP